LGCLPTFCARVPSQALLVIPKTLAVNAALDATEVVSQLCVFHNTAQKVVRFWMGRDVMQRGGGRRWLGRCARHCFERARHCFVRVLKAAKPITAASCFRRVRASCMCVCVCVCVLLGAPQADKAHLKYMGLDLVKGEVVDNLRAGVVEPSLSKVKSLHFATEAAISILRIDDFIKVNPPQPSGR
jgi:chaperonin GroEL (HSP60 family)